MHPAADTANQSQAPSAAASFLPADSDSVDLSDQGHADSAAAASSQDDDVPIAIEMPDTQYSNSVIAVSSQADGGSLQTPSADSAASSVQVILSHSDTDVMQSQEAMSLDHNASQSGDG